MNVNLKIVGYVPYPNGMALSQRLDKYAKGIVENGGKVEFLIPGPSERDVKTAKNIEHTGNKDRIQFQYTCGTVLMPSSFFARRLCKLTGHLKTLKIIISQRNSIDAVLFASLPYWIVFCYCVICRLCGILCIREASEFPFYNREPHTFFGKLYQLIYNRLSPKIFDGLIVISNSLQKHYSTRIGKNAGLLLIPILVDCCEFKKNSCEIRKPLIVCCGSLLTQKKDGVFTIIKAFARVNKDVPGFSLRFLGGDLKHPDLQAAKRLIVELGLEDQVDFSGYVPRNVLVKTLMEAHVLVLAKPESLQAKHCFPSKLAEYLASGNPIVVTDTGEISAYLKDGENAFIAEPDSVSSFAEKMKYVLQNDKISREVGQNGRRLAEMEFDYRPQGKRIVEFLGSLRNKRC